MQPIDKHQFMFLYTSLYGACNVKQTDGLNQLLDFLVKDDKITDIRWAAYILATVKRECGDKWWPISETEENRRDKPYSVPDKRTGQAYYGRGYPQTTWYDNYLVSQSVWNKAHPDRLVDFLKHPDQLLVPEYAYFCMSYSMRNGIYTGVGLSRYINDKVCDYYNARKIINGLDYAQTIAKWASNIERMLKESVIQP